MVKKSCVNEFKACRKQILTPFSARSQWFPQVFNRASNIWVKQDGTIFQNINPWKSVIQPRDMFNSRTYVSAQEHGTLQLIFIIINIKWALRWQIRVLFVIESAAAHKLKPGLSLTVKKVYGTCQQKRIHCSHDISWNLPYHTRSFIADDKDIANHDGKIFRTESRNKAAKY